MTSEIDSLTSLSRSSDHLGNLANVLKDLGGGATLLHELTQNANDAKADRICTQPSGWRQAADRRLAAGGAVGASSVVVLDPRGKGGGAFVVVGEDLAVGPLGDQGAVEAFGLAVLPWAVRLDE